MKCSGIARSDRSIISEAFAADRWIAPPDLIQRMAVNVDIRYEVDFDLRMRDGQEPVISTIPMPALMKLLDYPEQPKFEYIGGVNIRAVLSSVDAYVSIYVPDPKYQFNRISLTGNELIIEIAGEPKRKDVFDDLLFEALEILGLGQVWSIDKVTTKKQQYAKIQPIDDDLRREFQHWATDNYGIFSLGRFATWRPQTQLDDLVQDIRRIEGWINKGRYEVRKAR
jgi:hypothetical protein